MSLGNVIKLSDGEDLNPNLMVGLVQTIKYTKKNKE